MFEFPVIAFAANTLPAIGFESLENIDAAHRCVRLHTAMRRVKLGA
jgi:hypothetical protein